MAIHVSRVFFIARGLYTGMEATPKAPQGYHLWKRRLRAPTRDTFAYAKRLREESRKDLFHLSTEQLKLTKKNLTNRCLTKRVGLEGFVSGIQTEQGAFEARLRTGYACLRDAVNTTNLPTHAYAYSAGVPFMINSLYGKKKRSSCP